MWNEIKSIINQHRNSEDLLLSVIDKSGNLYYLNAEMKKVLENPEYHGKVVNLFDHVIPARVDEFKLFLQESEKTGIRQVTDLTVKNGHDHLLNLHIHAVDDPTLRRKLFFCVGKEIKPSPIAAIPMPRICPQSVSYQSMLSQIPGMTWVIDEQEHLIFANTAFMSFFHLEEKDLFAPISTLLPEKIITAFHQQHSSVLQGGQSAQSRKKAALADGTDVLFSISVFPVETNAGKKVIGGHAIVLEEDQLEKELKEANDHILLLHSATTDAIWEWDMNTGRIFRNDTLMDLIGYCLDETKGLTWWISRIHPEDRKRVADKVKNVTEKGLRSWEDEYRIKCADGEYKHIHDKGYVVYENGLAIKMIGSLNDVSELKALRSELHEEKLRRQQEISETVIHVQEMERTRIGYELHDNINQVISTARLFTDMLTTCSPAQENLKQKSLEYLHLAIEEIRKLSKDLVSPQLKEQGLVDSIATLIEDINLAGKVQIHFVHDRETDLLSAGKKVTLFRIVQEQLKNILKYSHAKNAFIYLHCNENTVKMVIKDNGIGFDSSHTPRGIGLSNIYERTRFYQGKANIVTAPHEGCMMTILIPFE